MILTATRGDGETLAPNGPEQYSNWIESRTWLKVPLLVVQRRVRVRRQEGVTVDVIENICTVITRLYYKVLGSSELLHYEDVCLRAWKSTLSIAEMQKVDSQLRKFDFIQRQARGTKSVFFSLKDPQYRSWSDAELFLERGEEKSVYVGNLSGRIGDVEESVKFRIYLHRGRLSSIEFSSEPGALATIKSGLRAS